MIPTEKADFSTFIGYVGEKNAREVEFSIPPGWSGCTVDNMIAVFQLPKSDNAIPFSVSLETSHNKAYWLVPDYATSRAGAGKLQLIHLKEGNNINDYVHNGEVVVDEKTPVYTTVCKPSVGVDVPTPDPKSPWIDDIGKIIIWWKSGGFSKIAFVETRPAQPQTDILYAVGTGTNYVLETYHNSQWVTLSGGGGSATWGDIAGDIQNQIDLWPRIQECGQSDIDTIFI